MVVISETPSKIHDGVNPADWLHSVVPQALSAQELASRRVKMYLTRARLAKEGITPEKLFDWKQKHGKIPVVTPEKQMTETGERFLQGEAVTHQNG